MFCAIFLFITIISLASADGYKCAGNHTIGPPPNLSIPYYYPTSWNETMPPPQYNSSQLCVWNVNVPYGMYATVVFYKISQNQGIDFVYPNSQSDWLFDNDTSPIIFTSPQFHIRLNATHFEGFLSFKIVWSYYPSNLCQESVVLDSTDISPNAISTCLITYNTPNQIRIAGYFNSPESQRLIQRHSAIFEGDSTNGTFLGTLYQAFIEDIFSNGQTVTVYTFGLHENHPLYLVMDVSAAPNIVYFQTPKCYASGLCNIDLFTAGTYTYATVTSSQNVDYVGMSSFFPYNSSISIYEGKVTEERLLAILNQSDYYNKLPMAVKSPFKIYLISKGAYTLRLYNTSEKASYNLLESGRQVNIHSFGYRQESDKQYTMESFSSTPYGSLMTFDFNVKYFDMVGTTSLGITVYRNGSVVNMFRFFKENPPSPPAFSLLGDSVTVEYQPYGYYTNGFEVDMLCTAYVETTTTFTTGSTSRAATETSKTIPTTTSTRLPSSAITTRTITKTTKTTETVETSSSASTYSSTTTVQSSTTVSVNSTTTVYETTTSGVLSILEHAFPFLLILIYYNC